MDFLDKVSVLSAEFLGLGRDEGFFLRFETSFSTVQAVDPLLHKDECTFLI